jgi:hypothetical protein
MVYSRQRTPYDASAASGAAMAFDAGRRRDRQSGGSPVGL